MMRLGRFLLPLLAFGFLLPSAPAPLRASEYDAVLAAMSSGMAACLATKDRKTVAVVDFTDLEGGGTPEGRLIAEEFSIELHKQGQSRGLEVTDRGHLSRLLEELALRPGDLDDPASSRRLGERAGVKALITGTVTLAGETLEVTVKALAPGEPAYICSGRQILPAASSAEPSAPPSSPAPPGASVDAVPPRVVLDSPADGLLTRDPGVELRGRIVDAHPKTLVLPSAETAVGGDGAFSLELPLSEGTNRIALSGRDSAGHQGPEVIVTVQRDSRAPAILSLSPKDGSEVAGTRVRLEGEADEKLARAELLSEAITVSGNAFAAEVNLEAGENDLPLKLWDPAGNLTEAAWRVVCRRAMPAQPGAEASSDQASWEDAERGNTIQAYRDFLRAFPDSPHATAARKRIVDLEVQAINQASPGQLPKPFRIHGGGHRAYSVVNILNDTEYRLTIRYSGERDSFAVTFEPREKASIELLNGKYRVAASVNSPSVRSYAGEEDPDGSNYHVNYYVGSGLSVPRTAEFITGLTQWPCKRNVGEHLR